MKIAYTNGVKSYDAPMNDPSAWVTLGQLGYREEGAQELMARVAVVSRARELMGVSVGHIPFALVNENGDQVDNSMAWKNVVGFMPRPKDLLRRWRMSQIDTNAAYGFFDGKRPGSPESTLRYILPWSITPRVSDYGIEGFERQRTKGNKEYFPINSGRIVYLYRLDHTTELLPSEYTEQKALLEAAGIMREADRWIANFFAGGGVPPTLVGIKGVTTKTATEELETRFDKFIKSLSRLRAKVFNADAMEVKQIGSGIEALKDTDVYRQSMTSVCSVFGIPVSLFLSDFANKATADAYYWSWYKDKVIPDCEDYAEQLTEQVFKKMGLYWTVLAEQAEPNQAEEVERASAFATYVNAGIKPSVAAQIVGVDLPNGMDYEELDEEEEPTEPEPATPEEDAQEDAAEDMPEETPAKFVPSLDQIRELNRWQVFAFRKLKKAEPLDFPFRLDVTPQEVGDAIRARLVTAKTEDEIKAAFVVAETNIPAPAYVDYSYLLEGIKAGVEALKVQPTQPNITVNTAQT